MSTPGDYFIARVFAVMAATPRHTYQLLTKRHGRMRAVLNSRDFRDQVGSEARNLADAGRVDPGAKPDWPLPNVHLGVSAENQKWADIRIGTLMATPAAVRWVSAEPLLGPLELPAGLDWVVVGGESGPRARPCREEWIRGALASAQGHGTPVFVKQLGTVWERQVLGTRGKGGDPAAWPADLRVRDHPVM